MRLLALGIGSAGSLLMTRYAALFWRVIHGPGDDNAVALLFLIAGALSMVPAAGLYVALLKEPWPALPKAWLAVSVLVLAAVAPFALL